MISSPSEYPRAYICDECVAACAAIIEDDQADSQAMEDVQAESLPHPLLSHPLASTLMESIESWIRKESLGKDGLIALRAVRALANQMQTDILNLRTDSDHDGDRARLQ